MRFLQMSAVRVAISLADYHIRMNFGLPVM